MSNERQITQKGTVKVIGITLNKTSATLKKGDTVTWTTSKDVAVAFVLYGKFKVTLRFCLLKRKKTMLILIQTKDIHKRS